MTFFIFCSFTWEYVTYEFVQLSLNSWAWHFHDEGKTTKPKQTVHNIITSIFIRYDDAIMILLFRFIILSSTLPIVITQAQKLKTSPVLFTQIFD